jgi:hypothetical protein
MESGNESISGAPAHRDTILRFPPIQFRIFGCVKIPSKQGAVNHGGNRRYGARGFTNAAVRQV